MTSGLAELTEKELARRALEGHQPCYGELMRRHRDAVYRLVRAAVRDADEALDVTQESFIAAFAALTRYDSDRPFRLWVSRIAINKCHDWARRRTVRRFFTFARPIDEALDISDHAGTPEEHAAAKESMARLTAAIDSLPAKLRDILVLRAIEDFSQADTAHILGITEKAVETRLYRARAKLSGKLRD